MIRTAPLRIGLLLVMGWAPGCDTTEGTSPADAEVRDAAATDLELPDAARGERPPGASCADTLQCSEGECLHGVCSVSCDEGGGCPETAAQCVERGGGRWCTARCEAASDCPEAQICAVLGPGEGMCVGPGGGEGGAPCDAPQACASWVCADGQCLESCAGGQCPEGLVCLPLHTQSVCVGAGAGVAESPCALGEDCASGICRGGRCATACTEDGLCPEDRLCLVFEQLSLCERLCADTEGCGEGAVCAVVGGRRLCVTRGAAPAGEACDRDAGCDSGRCESGRCAARCDAGASCAGGEICLVDISGGVCVSRGPVPTGAACRQDGECETGVCAAGRCLPACPEGAGCPDGARCVEFLEGRLCYPACAVDADCGAGAYCALSIPGGPICLWRGSEPAGASCAADGQCASGRCVDGEGGARCAARCEDGRCPSGQRCYDFPSGPRCAAPNARSVGAACEDAPESCAEGLMCVGGRCTPPCGDGLCPEGLQCLDGWCEPTCSQGTDCRPGWRCNRVDVAEGRCERPGPLGADEACASSAECASGLCLDGLCRARCPEGGCGPSSRCVGAWCVPVGDGEAGATCEVGAACVSGLCLGRRCASPCGEGGLCPEGARCEGFADVQVCLFTCEIAEEACAPGEVCAPVGLTTEGICAEVDPGLAAAGEPCEISTDCDASGWTCLDAGDGAGARCRALCRLEDGRGCEADDVCASLRAAAEIGACLPSGPAPDMSPCERDADCASGVCLVEYAGGRCGRLCDDGASCAPEQLCANLTRDPMRPFTVCTSACEAPDECPEGLLCRRDAHGVGACY